MNKYVCLLFTPIVLWSCKTKKPVEKVEEGVNYSYIKDNSGNSYRTIQIGSQKWMVDNLKTVRYSDVVLNKFKLPVTDSIRTLPADSSILYREELSLDTLSYYWKYQGGVSKLDFGNLYTWYTVKNRYVCPQGWRVPTVYDWEKLITFLGGPEIAGGKLKSTDTLLWENPNQGATNSSDFAAIGGGYKTEFATFINQLKYGLYWSSSEDVDFKDGGVAYMFYAGSVKSYKITKSKKAALSVRCISDK